MLGLKGDKDVTEVVFEFGFLFHSGFQPLGTMFNSPVGQTRSKQYHSRALSDSIHLWRIILLFRLELL